MATQNDAIESKAKRQPVYWFVRLELATAAGDMEAAADAVRELRRLGIDVTYRCRPRARKAVQS
jgi:hypothetical protein